MASDGPPAENGTMMVMGREGKVCAKAEPKARAQYRQNQSSHYYLPQSLTVIARSAATKQSSLLSQQSWIASLRSQ